MNLFTSMPVLTSAMPSSDIQVSSAAAAPQGNSPSWANTNEVCCKSVNGGRWISSSAKESLLTRPYSKNVSSVRNDKFRILSVFLLNTLQDGGHTSSSSSSSGCVSIPAAPTCPSSPSAPLTLTVPSVFGSLATLGVRGRFTPSERGFRLCWCLCECERDKKKYLRKSMANSAKLPVSTNALLA